MFKIIALEICDPPKLKGVAKKPLADMSKNEIRSLEIQSRRESVTKRLTSSDYVFYEGYNKTRGFYIRNDECLDEDFFCKKSVNCPGVSISAVVGGNGSGKSTLLTYIVRMMNNFAYMCRNAFSGYKDGDLLFVDEVYGKLYGEIDGEYFRIEQSGNGMSVQFSNDGEIIELDNNYNNERLRYILERLFYTIVVDYSAYDWNVYDYASEWREPLEEEELFTDNDRCWIGKLFHKNDSYQIPIVLNPFRSYGQINYGNEQSLLTDRLLLLIIKEKQNVDGLLLQKHAELLTFDSMKEFSCSYEHKFPSSKLLQMLVNVGVVRNKQKYNRDIVIELCNYILGCWSRCYGIDFDKMANEERDNSDVNRAINYIVYKTIKISTVYSQYRRYSTIYNSNEYRNLIDEYIAHLYDDETHITLKLRKTFAFLLFRHYGTNMGRRRNGSLIHEIKIEKFGKQIEYIKGHQQEKINALRGKYRIRNVYEHTHTWKEEELLPAPCFKTDILLKEPQCPVDAFLRYSMMSSGEKQIINAMCTFVYHMYNLDSAFNTEERLKYKNVNMIFDELELYFHPKYQAMLVDSILKTIKGMKLRNIKNVNIIMSTHSPFILSDIPKSNTLKIEDGVCKYEKENNFCANVYDILNSHFFMDEFIGNFAKKKLEEIFSEVKGFCKNGNIDEKKVERDVRLIGDDVVRFALLERIGERSERLKKETELEEARQKLKELEDDLKQYEQ